MKIPEITRRQMAFMQSKKKAEEVTVNGITVNIQPYMFPPTSPYSYSTRVLLDSMKAQGKKVLEIGTGCGILSVFAAKQGANVDGVDILPECVQYSLDNAIRNGVFEKTRFFYSNMFSTIDSTYDEIICNLPILEGEIPDNNPAWYSLFDPSFAFHEELFEKGKKYAPKITLAHADIAGCEDFTKLEDLAKKKGWKPSIQFEKTYADQRWRSYAFEQ